MSTTPTFPDDFNMADYFLFDRIEEGLGERVAIRYGTRTYSYADVASRSRALASRLVSHRGRRALIVLPDTPPFAWAIFGVLAAGETVAMGNPASPTKDLAYLLEYTRAECLVTMPAVAERIADSIPLSTLTLLVPDTATGEDPEGPLEVPNALLARGLHVQALADVVAEAPDDRVELPRTKRDEVCYWLFTSGSTGQPKAAMHTHRDFAFNTEVYAKNTVGYQRDDVTVSVPNLYFGYATGTNLFFPFAVGATAALFSERPTPESLAKAIAEYRPTVVTNVPTMLGKLLEFDAVDRKGGGAGLDMSCVRFHLSAGEALPPALLTRFNERWDCDVYDGIGSAEMFHIYASNRPGDIKPGSLGRVVDGYEIAILPREATGPGAAPLPPGETGVMWVKGDSVALGYHQDRDKSWSTFHGHWCRTGDLFRIDEDQYLWFSGRADDIFKVSGVWVAPLQVEDCLLEHQAVSVAAVIPAEEEGLTKPKAFVVLRESHRDADRAALRAELKQHVKDSLHKHKYPRWVVFVDELPKNDRGKIDRKVLKQREAAGENPSE